MYKYFSNPLLALAAGCNPATELQDNQESLSFDAEIENGIVSDVNRDA